MTIANVLDHGYVRLVESMGNDLSIVRSARVSYDAAWRSGDDEGKDAKLIHYLMRNRHTTPFESVMFTFEVKAPIFVFRQWHRHRTWSYNEISARYTELPGEFYVPEADQIGVQSKETKQARSIENLSDESLLVFREVEREVLKGTCDRAFTAYQYLLDNGWPRELARSVLPVCTYSKMFATVDLHNLFHFLRLRLDPHAQYEIRVYAEAMLGLITPVVPIAVQAWRESVMGEEAVS